MQGLKELLRRFVVSLLTLEARAVLKKYRPKIIVVTGSVGKTTTKDAVYTALKGSSFIRRSEKSYNSDIGVPLTILGVPNGWNNPVRWIKNLSEGLLLIIMQAPYPKWLVMEVGADRPNDIKKLSWLAPQTVVATRFPDVSVHVEFYESPEAVIKEELAPVGWLQSGGVLIANADDERAKNVVIAKGVRRVTYGFSKDAAVRASRLHMSVSKKMPSGMSFDIVYGDSHGHVVLAHVLGEQHASAALAGIAVALAAGVPLQNIIENFAEYEPPSGRMRLIAGMRGSMLIDDTYNSSPAAAEKALQALAEAPRSGKRIAVLADMLELGSFSVEEHHRIGTLTAQSADVLITTGVRARGIAKGALEAGMKTEAVFECETGADAAGRLVSLIAEGDVALIKGSQSMRMERVVKSVMAEPAKAPNMLVRQDAEWVSRK
ncbi:UDP-N-acetylmuramoyl-tripeptide--D-alanyl-D-alanine ligase [Candidatus Kaiserbacteria bacterium]|nr:UDP-N-acetylmuramoyl-tripeptide--D-alanyl-D-alanine ligase [Candidatus Kaiserbacteria bacterium]